MSKSKEDASIDGKQTAKRGLVIPENPPNYQYSTLCLCQGVNAGGRLDVHLLRVELAFSVKTTVKHCRQSSSKYIILHERMCQKRLVLHPSSLLLVPKHLGT